MRVAVIMPALNAEATITSALKSIIRQRDAADFDIIVIDDGSIDRTRHAVRDLAASTPEIRLIENARGGISKARNSGLHALAPDTELVSFLDADDLSPNGRFERDIAVLESNPGIELVYSKVRFFDSEDPGSLAPCSSSHIVDGRVVQLGAGLFRRRLVDRVGLFDETLLQSEDLDYLMRVFEQRPNYYLSGHVGVFYRKNHGGITESRRQAQHELMKALVRAHKRRAKLIGFTMPEDIFNADHVPELASWSK